MSTISSVVVSRYKAYTRDSFVVKHIAFFLCTTNLEAVSVLFLLTCIYPLTPRPHPQLTHSTPSLFTSATSAPPARYADCGSSRDEDEFK